MSSIPENLSDSSLPWIAGLELKGKIGEGGLSIVYHAIHLNLQRSVAVKILRRPSDQYYSVPSWLHESRLMASLVHPHIVTIHDAGQSGTHHYLVMEYLTGGSLRSRMTPDCPWPLAEALSVLDPIAQALEHIHRQDILHLDLKPENILFTPDGEVKITDFGLSIRKTEDVRSLITGHDFRGTIDYAPPEQLSGKPLDCRYDVFSLATIAYELLTGRLPGRVYKSATRRNPQLPAAIDEVLHRGLARDPNDRYSSISEFRNALQRASQTNSISTACRNRKRQIAIGALGIIALMVFLVSWIPDNPKRVLESKQVEHFQQPTRVWILHKNQEDLSLLQGDKGLSFLVEPKPQLDVIKIEDPSQVIPTDLSIPFWPTPETLLVVHSPRAWGFVCPVRDQTLGQKVIANWGQLLHMKVPKLKNYVKSGGFEGDCLIPDHQGDLWRTSDQQDWNAERKITLDYPADQPENPALLLTYLKRVPEKSLLGCYQSIPHMPSKTDSILVLRYRARTQKGKGKLSVYLGMPVVVPPNDHGEEAKRIRQLGNPLSEKGLDQEPDQWLYRTPCWVTTTEDWQQYIIVFELPSFPTRLIHRNLVIDITDPSQVWVDDVELFVWQPRSEP